MDFNEILEKQFQESNVERNVTAEKIYAGAWALWLKAETYTVKAALEIVMDKVQPQIARGPKDPRWKKFTETLPGFNDYWKSLHKKLKEITILK